MPDPYLWPDANCLKNRLNIRDPIKLAEVEAKLVAVRDVQLAREPLPGEYNLTHLQRFHRTLFRDIYDWAGKTRTVNLTKDGVTFCSWRFVDDEVSAVLGGIAQDRWLIGMSRERLLNASLTIMASLTLVIPSVKATAELRERSCVR